MTSASHAVRVEHLLRELAPQVLGAVMRRFRDFAASEDATQEAMIAAATQWPREGIPDSPRGWLIQVALRRMTDYIRSEISRRNREAVAAAEVPVVVAPAIYSEPQIDPEDTLVLLFMCCHPALSQASAIALTLRAVGGLTIAEIAKAFFVPEATMAQRISRAKQNIKTSGVSFSMPSAEERGQRLSSVLELLAPLSDDSRLDGNHRLDAVRAHLMERAGEREAAAELYRAAATKTTSVPERNYLVMRAARLSEAP